ncbi:large-conductance mechanosensitive channel [Bacillus mycoides]
MHKYLKQFLSFIWNIFVKSIPLHTAVLWFFPDVFKAYTTFINRAIKIYPSYTVLAFIIAFYLFTHLQMKREQKNNRSTDQENSDSQSEKKQRSIK